MAVLMHQYGVTISGVKSFVHPFVIVGTTFPSGSTPNTNDLTTFTDTALYG
jgi:hypothetical protein